MNTLAWILICCLCFCVGIIFVIAVWLIIDIICDNQLIKSLAKEDKAIKIILSKDIKPTSFYLCKDYETYLWQCKDEGIDKEWILTKEEFNLLKKVFDNEKEKENE